MPLHHFGLLGLFLTVPILASFPRGATSSSSSVTSGDLKKGYLLPGVFGPYTPEQDFTMNFRFAFNPGEVHRLVFEPHPGTIPLSGGGTSTLSQVIYIDRTYPTSPASFALTIPSAYLSSSYLIVRLVNYYDYDSTSGTFKNHDYVNDVVYLFPPQEETLTLPSGSTFGSRISTRSVIGADGTFSHVARTYQGQGLASSFTAAKDGWIYFEKVGLKDVTPQCSLDFSFAKASLRLYDHLNAFAIGDYYPTKGYREIPLESYLGFKGFTHFRLAQKYLLNVATREMREGGAADENEIFTQDFYLPRSLDYTDTSISAGFWFEGVGDFGLTKLDYRFQLKPYSGLVGGCDEASYCVGVG
jgi:hypothetical protein